MGNAPIGKRARLHDFDIRKRISCSFEHNKISNINKCFISVSEDLQMLHVLFLLKENCFTVEKAKNFSKLSPPISLIAMHKPESHKNIAAVAK